MKKALFFLFFLAPIVTFCQNQPDVTAAMGSAYAGGTFTATQINPSGQSQNVSAFFDGSGNLSIFLAPGSVQQVRFCTSSGLTCGQASFAVLGSATAPMSITTILTGASSASGGAALAGNANAIYASPACPVVFVAGTNCYFVNANTKIYFGNATTISVSSGQSTITCTNCFTSAVSENGKRMKVTNGCCNNSIAAATAGVIIGSGTITFVDTSHVTLSQNASGTCTTTCVVAFGNDDTANLTTISAAMAAVQGCATLILPTGVMFTNSGQFNQMSASCGASFTDAYGGNTILGQGSTASIIFTGDNFSFNTSTSCNGSAGGLNICFGAGVAHGENFQVYGGFDSQAANAGSGRTSIAIWGSPAVTGNVMYDRVAFQDFDGGDGSGATGTVGLLLNAGQYDHVIVVGFGAIACEANSSLGFNTTFSAGACGNTLEYSLTVQNGALLNTNGVVFGQTGSTQPTVNCAGKWNSNYDYIFNNPGGNVNSLFAGNSGCTFHWTGMNANQGGQTGAFGGGYCLSGCVGYIGQTIALRGGTTGTAFTNQGTIYNLGGNNVTGTVTNTGTIIQLGIGEAGTVACSTSSATITFKNTYSAAPNYTIQDRTTAGVVTQTSINATTLVLGCPGASDNLNYTITPSTF